MEQRKALQDKRNHKRYRAREGAFAVLRPSFTRLGQILDISQGGLAFGYLVTGDQNGQCSEIDIFLKGNGFCLERLPVQKILETRMGRRFSMSSLPMKRCGVQFGRMSASQRSRLREFLKEHTAHNP